MIVQLAEKLVIETAGAVTAAPEPYGVNFGVVGGFQKGGAPLGVGSREMPGGSKTLFMKMKIYPVAKARRRDVCGFLRKLARNRAAGAHDGDLTGVCVFGLGHFRAIA